jgi:hypothetical protein
MHSLQSQFFFFCHGKICDALFFRQPRRLRSAVFRLSQATEGKKRRQAPNESLA